VFYEFCLEDRVPADHLLRKIDRFLDLRDLRQELAPFYSTMGRPSIDPELMIRMLIAADAYTCPGGKLLRKYRRPFTKPRVGVTKDKTLIYNASQHDCAVCALKARCCPGQPRRKIARSIHEAARDVVRSLRDTQAYLQSCRERNKVEMLFAHLKRILIPRRSDENLPVVIAVLGL
jgi:hypothetical protein